MDSTTTDAHSIANNTADLNTTNTVLPAHGLNEDQLKALKSTSNDLETHLLHCVDDIHRGLWPHGSSLKVKAELHLRKLVVCPVISRIYYTKSKLIYL